MNVFQSCKKLAFFFSDGNFGIFKESSIVILDHVQLVKQSWYDLDAIKSLLHIYDPQSLYGQTWMCSAIQLIIHTTFSVTSFIK